jgi:prepilin-type N-terminal cleavage/methylation domain-containing protein
MNDDRGFSLIELTVVVLLLGVLGAITTAVIVNGFRREADNEGRAAAVQQVRTALERTLRDVREADPLLSVTTTSLAMLLTDTNNASRMVCYSVVTSGSDSSLQRVVSPPGGTCTDPTAQTSIVVGHLDNTAVFLPVSDSWSPSYADPTSPARASVDTHDCGEKGISPLVYKPGCVGAVQVSLVVKPLNTSTGGAVCSAGNASTCDISVSDSALLRNAT